MPNTVYVVHCIDTEGPLYESLAASFDRLRAIFGIDLPPSRATLRRLQAGEIDLGGREDDVRRVFDPQLLAYNDSWDKIDAMLHDAMSMEFRMRLPDSFGNGWVYSWFCVDHVDYDANPRRRDMGYHNVFDHYREMMRETNSPQDELQFHYHPHSFSREAHRCATRWWGVSDSLSQVLSRRVIERSWFPAANRPGFHVTRPDSHWFLEQHIPFDYASQAIVPRDQDSSQADQADGRFGDWRRAPRNWQPYHPSPDDYQVPGSCRRWIARCLNIGTRYRVLDDRDVRQAFEEANTGLPTILAVTNHDFRDLRPDVDGVRAMLARNAKLFPGVTYSFASAVDAIRSALGLAVAPPCELDMLLQSRGHGRHVLSVQSRTPTFGPQPWLALKTLSGDFHTDNFDIDVPFHRWQYVFDEDTFPICALSGIGVAANNAFGATTVKVMSPSTGTVRTTHWNAGQKCG